MALYPLVIRRGRELTVLMARLGVDQTWLHRTTKLSKGRLSEICTNETARAGTHKAIAVIIMDVLAAEWVRQFGSNEVPTLESIFEVFYNRRERDRYMDKLAERPTQKKAA